MDELSVEFGVLVRRSRGKKGATHWSRFRDAPFLLWVMGESEILTRVELRLRGVLPLGSCLVGDSVCPDSGLGFCVFASTCGGVGIGRYTAA